MTMLRFCAGLIACCLAAPLAAAADGPPAGSYTCMMSRYQQSYMRGSAGPMMIVVYDGSAFGTIAVDGRGGYRQGERREAGAYRAEGGRLIFTSGPLAGWPAIYMDDEGKIVLRLAASKEAGVDPANLRVGEHRCRPE
jgi:hypothetical protein